MVESEFRMHEINVKNIYFMGKAWKKMLKLGQEMAIMVQVISHSLLYSASKVYNTDMWHP